MSTSDEFFTQLDREIEAREAEEEEVRETAREQERMVRRFMHEAVPRLEEYKQQPEQRGVGVKLEHTDTTLTFLIYFRDGGHWGFRLTGDRKSGSYRVQGMFTSDDGEDYVSEGGGAGTEKTWSWSGFEKYVQAEIKSFFFYADRHGGYKQRTGP